MEFIKHRFNVSLNSIGVDSLFEINEALLETTEWFDDEILTQNTPISSIKEVLTIVKNLNRLHQTIYSKKKI